MLLQCCVVAVLRDVAVLCCCSAIAYYTRLVSKGRKEIVERLRKQIQMVRSSLLVSLCSRPGT